MFELRWVKKGASAQLEYRVSVYDPDTFSSEWKNWKTVEMFDENAVPLNHETVYNIVGTA